MISGQTKGGGRMNIDAAAALKGWSCPNCDYVAEKQSSSWMKSKRTTYRQRKRDREANSKRVPPPSLSSRSLSRHVYYARFQRITRNRVLSSRVIGGSARNAFHQNLRLSSPSSHPSSLFGTLRETRERERDIEFSILRDGTFDAHMDFENSIYGT